MSPSGIHACTRRAMIARGALGAAAMAVGAEVVANAAEPVIREENPWRYDVESLRRVDPALVRYRETHAFAVAQKPVRRIAFDAKGNLHLAAGRSWVTVEPNGRVVNEVNVGDVIRCVRTWSNGQVLLAFRDRVEVWTDSGERKARWAGLPGKPFITGLAATDREVFIADAGNRVVYRCDPGGRVDLRIGERQEDRQIPGLVLPSPFLDVEVGADGFLRVNNPGRHRVEVYSREGDLVQSWGRAGVAIDAFCGCCNPIAVEMLPDGRCVTAEKGLPRVKVHRPDGALESVVAAPDAFEGNTSDARADGRTETGHEGLDIAVDATGRVAVLDLVAARVHLFERATS